jgi:hypothetical protein
VLLTPRKIPSLASDKVKEYRKMLASDDPKVRKKAKKIASGNWMALVTGSNAFQAGYFADEVWTIVEMTTTKAFNDVQDAMFHIDDEGYTTALQGYIKDMRRELTMALNRVNAENDAAQIIKDKFIAKFKWYLYDHGDLHYAPVIPLLTPCMVTVIANVLERVPKALTEVGV